MTRPLVLIPSSKAKAAGGAAPIYRRSAAVKGRGLPAARREVLAALEAAAEELDDPGIARLCGVRPDGVAEQRERLAVLGKGRTLPAHRRYTGVVHRFARLDEVDPAAAGVEVGTLTGLLGVAMLDDPVPDYRLEVMGRVPGLGVLGTWWRHRLGEHLRELASDRLVWDLLPGEFGKLWPDSERTDVEVLTVAFQRPDGRAAPAASAKVAKGHLLRLLLDEPSIEPTDLASQQPLEGWTFTAQTDGVTATLTT